MTAQNTANKSVLIAIYSTANDDMTFKNSSDNYFARKATLFACSVGR